METYRRLYVRDSGGYYKDQLCVRLEKKGGAESLLLIGAFSLQQADIKKDSSGLYVS